MGKLKKKPGREEKEARSGRKWENNTNVVNLSSNMPLFALELNGLNILIKGQSGFFKIRAIT